MAGVKQVHTPKESETYARLTAAIHVKASSFREHQKIEGYFENRDVPDFMGSDRLLRLDTLYGTIQFGYNPRKGQSFLFANIKTSVLDTAPSSYQRELKEYQMMRTQKTGTPNIAYSAKRRGGSSVLLYKMENQPWTQRSILPYLRRVNMEALQKTMPFLEKENELRKREEIQREQKDLNRQLAEKMRRHRYGEMAALRARQLALHGQKNSLNAIVYRKDTQQRLFFRRLNASLDIQKHEMYAFYRYRRLSGKTAQKDMASVENNNKRNEEQDE